MPTFFFLFRGINARPIFGTDKRRFFPESLVLLRQLFTVNLIRFTPYIFAAIWIGNMADKKEAETTKSCNKSGWTLEIMKSRCCLIRTFKNTSLSYRIHCCCARSSCSLLSKRHKNDKKDSSIVV